MRDILISENITGAAVDRLSARFNVVHLPELWKNPELLAERIRNASALIVRNQTRVTRDVLRAARELLVVSRAGAGLDNIDVEAATEAGILITYAPDQNSISAAEHTMALLLALAHRVTAADADTKAGGWNRHRFFGYEIYGKRLGIIGLGKIGYLTAMRAQAFGMNILACDPQVSRDNVYVAQLNAQLVDLEELLENADFVCCHVPSNVQTIGMLNRERIAKMKPTSCIINTARGEVIEEADLVDALKSGRIGGAALDVRASEPPARGELETLPNVILTPYISAFTEEAQDRVTRAVCEDVARVLEGKPPEYPANRPRSRPVLA